MSAITPRSPATFVDLVEVPHSSGISLQIDIIDRKVREVITELSRQADLPPIKAARIQKDAPNMLKECEISLKQLMTPSSIRDSSWYHFDAENHAIDLEEDASAEERDRCLDLLKTIANCGFDLPEKIGIQTYQNLAHQAEKVRIAIKGFKREMELFNKPSANREKFSSELAYLKDVVLRLRRKVNILSKCVGIHKSGNVNSFTLGGEQRFIEFATRANKVGFETLRAICLQGKEEVDKILEVAAAVNPVICQTIKAIENNAFEILQSIQENAMILSPPVKEV